MTQTNQEKALQIVGTQVLKKTLQREKQGYKVICHEGGSRCFTPEQKVITKNGTKKISDIEVGDFVLSGHDKKYKKVKNVFKMENKKPCYEITLKNGNKIKATQDHKIWYEGGWHSLKYIVQGYCFRKEGYMESYLTLDDIASVKEIDLDIVYDIEVEDNHNYYLDCGKPILVHNSSKTWSIFQFFILKALAGEKLTITIVRDKMTWIKSTLLLDFRDLVEKYDLEISPEVNVNRAEQVYNINGTEIAFFGLDYAEKLHGRTQDWFWINETMEVAKKHFDQLEMRTNIGGILDYNPYDDSHWVFDLPKRDDVEVIHSTMLDNPFLPPAIINKIKSYESTEENLKRGTADNYMWQVYGLGKKARLEGLIFEDWKEVKEIPEDAKLLGYGLDFGFSNDPTALVELHYFDQTVYLKELIYETGLLNSDIVALMTELKVPKSALIVADSAEPKSIEEIRKAGFYNIKGAKKGPDSIRFGIDLLLGKNICYTEDSINLDREKRRYKWAEDRFGNKLKNPVDEFNHCMDAIRYIAVEVLSKKFEFQSFNRDLLGL
jgi:phage terminase large subunit